VQVPENGTALAEVARPDTQWLGTSFANAFQYHQQGMLAEAQKCYEAILQKYPDSAEAIHYLGVVAFQQKQFERADALFKLSIERDPSVAKYYCNYGLLLLEQGRYEQVIDSQNKAIQLLPGYAEPYLNLSTAWFKLRRYAESALAARRAIELRAVDAKAHDNLGTAQRFLYDYPASIASHERAIELDPAYLAAYTSLAATYLEMKNLNAVSIYCQRAIALDANDMLAHMYLGLAYREQGMLEQARNAILHATNLDPNNDLARWNLGLNMLAMGELVQGWQNYEARWLLEDVLPVRMQHFPYPWWQGQAMPDKTILIWWEQGIGDQIMFASMLNDAIPYFKKCVIACPKKLVNLYNRSFPAAQIVCYDDAQQMASITKVIDVQSAIGSLARWLRSSAGSFPRKNSYLHPDPDRVTYWKNRLSDLGPGLKIGICWRSGNTAGARQLYCSRIDQWAPILLLPGIHFVNLQYDECSAELAQARQMFGVTVHAFPEVDLFNDLDEAAALTAALDLVIAIPTTSAILAAALGVPSWMLTCGFNWQKFGTDENCWYGSARQFQRRWDQTWEAFLGDIAHELEMTISVDKQFKVQ
jgi:tetratricopeptide (TPR) repeat protein